MHLRQATYSAAIATNILSQFRREEIRRYRLLEAAGPDRDLPVHHATGIRVRDLPITLDKLL